jgi:hypothetical protein
VERGVRSGDPSLSRQANELLTEELRERVGADRVTVPAEAVERMRSERGRGSTAKASLLSNRPLLIVATCTVLVVAVASSLATGSWWAATAVVVLAVAGLCVVTFLALQLTTETEHLAPETAARLEEEGVGDPDKVFTDLLEGYAGATDAHGTTEILASGGNRQRALPEDNPARAAVEQRTSWTPSSAPGTAGGSGSAVAALPWWVVGGMIVLSLAFAVIGGGDLWLLPAFVIPIGIAFIVYERWFDDRREEGARGPSTGRQAGDDGAAVNRGLAPLVAGAVLLTLAIMIVGGFVAGAF